MGLKILSEMASLALVQRLQGLDSSQVKNAFMANYLAGVVMLRAQDLRGLILLNDPANSKLTAFRPGMSDVTFWGRAVFYSTDPLVIRALKPGHAALLASDSDRILDSRIQKLMKVIMTSPESVDWQELVASLVILRHRFDLNSSYFNKIVRGINDWERLSSSGRKSIITASFMYLIQSDPKSALVSRVRELAGASTLGDIRALAQKVISFKRLVEDEGTSTANIATGSPVGPEATANAIITRGDAKPAIEASYTLNSLAPLQVGSKAEAARQLGRSKRSRMFKLTRFKDPRKVVSI